MKKATLVFAAFFIIAAAFSGCSGEITKNSINVITREEGSGTRSAFVELFGIETESPGGGRLDNTKVTAETTNSTAVMITSVATDPSAVGYISMGALNDSVKALLIDGAEPTAQNIKSGEYRIARPFIIAYAPNASQAALDFIDFIMSDEGQAVADESGYVSVGGSGDYSGAHVTGTVNVSGSSSVYPMMEKLGEKYERINPGVSVVIQQNDSTSGTASVINGVSDIAMVSRQLSESERAAGLTPLTAAMDGIAVIVNKENAADSLTSGQVRAIYTGEITQW